MNILVTPQPGRRVRHPDTGAPLAAAGEIVPLTSYWRRRERDGDVTLGTIKAASPPASLPPAKPKK
jgi:hypothetical protein